MSTFLKTQKQHLQLKWVKELSGVASEGKDARSSKLRVFSMKLVAFRLL